MDVWLLVEPWLVILLLAEGVVFARLSSIWTTLWAPLLAVFVFSCLGVVAHMAVTAADAGSSEWPGLKWLSEVRAGFSDVDQRRLAAFALNKIVLIEQVILTWIVTYLFAPRDRMKTAMFGVMAAIVLSWLLFLTRPVLIGAAQPAFNYAFYALWILGALGVLAKGLLLRARAVENQKDLSLPLPVLFGVSLAISVLMTLKNGAVIFAVTAEPVEQVSALAFGLTGLASLIGLATHLASRGRASAIILTLALMAYGATAFV